MIDLYASPTPNVLKIEIMLEEIGLSYNLKQVNVWKGEQFEDAFVSLNPNSKVPVIVDYDHPDGPLAVFESAAILFYLAEKAGRFLPVSGRKRHDVMQWTIFQAANIGPMNGQFNHFEHFADAGNHYALSRYMTEMKRLYGVLERRLSQTPYLAGDEYSIADMATFPWVFIQSRRLKESFPFFDADSSETPGIAAWTARCLARPAVQRGITVHENLKSGLATATPDDLDRIFGRGRYSA